MSIRKKLILSFMILAGLLRFIETSFAQEAERKELQGLFITERASSQQEKGEWQINSDFEYRRNKTDELKQYKIPVGLEYGIFDWLEFGLKIPYVWQKNAESTDGFGNLKTEFGFLLLKGNDEIPYIVTGFEIGFPTVDEGKDIAGEEKKYSYEGSIKITKNFSFFITDINFNYEQSKNDASVLGTSEKENELEYNIGADFLLDKIFKMNIEGLHFITEFNGKTNLDNNVDKFYLTSGIKYVFTGGLELGFGIPLGLNTQSDDFRIISSLTYEWGGVEDE